MENTQNIKDLVQKFYPYAKNTLGFEHPVRVIMRQDVENAENPLGNTAYYDPEQKLIVLYVTNYVLVRRQGAGLGISRPNKKYFQGCSVASNI